MTTHATTAAASPTTWTVRRLTDLEDPAIRAGLHDLLRDAVNGGASVGYHPPLDPALNAAFWDGVAAGVAAGSVVLLAAGDTDGRLAGTVQLALCGKPNGRHRAELCKLLVHSTRRRRGLARALLAAAEDAARAHGRSLLVLDTLDGDAGVPLYESAGWQRAGRIPGYTVEGDGGRGTTVIFFRPL